MGLTAAVLGVGLIGSTTYQGIKGQQEQKKALRRQEQTQRELTAHAQAADRRAESERRRIEARKPKLGSILGQEREAGRLSEATLITGQKGVTTQTLGMRTTLGGA